MTPSGTRGPDEPDRDQITRLLASVRNGDRRAIDSVFNLVYAELHQSARRQLARARPGQTLNTTVLVHEAYLKLVDSASANWADRGHFFAVAAKAMRQIIIDYARQASRKKRGGSVQRIPLDGIDVADEQRASSSSRSTPRSTGSRRSAITSRGSSSCGFSAVCRSTRRPKCSAAAAPDQDRVAESSRVSVSGDPGSNPD